MTTVDLSRAQFAATTVYHFLFVPVTIGLAFFVAIMQTIWHRSGDPQTTPPDPVFRHPAADQRGHRGGDRAGAGVRVRHELVGLFTFRGRRLRRPAGHGGPGRVLPGVDVPRAVGLRLGPAPEAGPPGLHLAGGGRQHALGRVHHGRQLVDAAPGRLHDQLEDRTGGAQQHRRRCSPTRFSCGATPTSCWLRR